MKQGPNKTFAKIAKEYALRECPFHDGFSVGANERRPGPAERDV